MSVRYRIPAQIIHFLSQTASNIRLQKKLMGKNPNYCRISLSKACSTPLPVFLGGQMKYVIKVSGFKTLKIIDYVIAENLGTVSTIQSATNESCLGVGGP